MEVAVHGRGNPGPFLSARDTFETEYDLEHPVHVRVRADPDERTWTAHYDTHHVMNVSKRVASSTMARELAVHEFAHMKRYEEGHISHKFSTKEALYLALTEPNPDQELTAHGLQIANHMKDIYADDITLEVTDAAKLVAFFESRLADALSRSDPDAEPTGAAITAVNAAFAVAMCERHGVIDSSHRLYDLAHAARNDAPDIRFEAFTDRFRSLAPHPSETEYRRELVGTIRSYAHEAPFGE